MPPKRAPDSGYVRFGKRSPAESYVRFGKRSPSESYVRFGKRAPSESYVRFGKRAPSESYVRFGKRWGPAGPAAFGCGPVSKTVLANPALRAEWIKACSVTRTARSQERYIR
jgi:hypothetical protein